MTVEVERKFVCDSDVEERLTEIGAVCKGEHQFTDQYFDTPDYTLTLRDFWLRKRDGCWELKCPVLSRTKQENNAEALCTNYREITDLSQIKDEVRKLLENGTEAAGEAPESSQQDAGEDVEGWVEFWKLECFAEYTTTRRSYALEDEGVRVDLDQADYGYCVGEIEVLVSDGDQVQSALQKIEATAEKLGLGNEEKVRGKMNVYLQRFRPDHYDKLMSTNVL